jgi:hypothetical protein
MPLTAKGEKIMSSMQEKHGVEKGKQVFYASKNAGRITGVDKKSDDDDKRKDQEKEESPVKETKTTVKEPAGGGEKQEDPKAKLKAAEDELAALEREQEQSEEGQGRMNAIDDQKKIIRQLRNEMRETEHKERMGIADAVEKLEYQQDSTLLMKHIGDAVSRLADRMDAFEKKKDYASAQAR